MKYDSCIWTNSYHGMNKRKPIRQYLDGNDNITIRKIIEAPFLFADTYTYASNKMIYRSEQIYPTADYNTLFYHYNTLGLLDTINKSNGNKTVLTYDVSNRLYQSLRYYSLDSSYLVRSTNSYNTAGQLTDILHEKYDTTLSMYVPTAKDLYIYTTAGDTDMIIKQNWNKTSSSWVNEEKNIYLSDVNHNVLSHIRIFWKSSTWDTFRRSKYVYNSRNQLVSNETDFWNSISHAWEYKVDSYGYGNSQRFSFVYEPYFPASVNTVEENKNITLYPLPASNSLNIEIKEGFDKPFNAAIYDMQGRLYTEWMEETCATYKKSIATNNLPNGIYCVKLSTPDGDITKRFVVER